MAIHFGADRLAAEPRLLGNVRRVALATNDAARTAADSELRTRRALLEAGIPLVRLFAPEHGLSARGADGAAVTDDFDTLTNLPVMGLYGEQYAPSAEALHDIDAVLFDVPDLGVRFYTYTWTLTHIIDACALAGVPLFVLDHPNPLSGALESAEGPMLEPEHITFVGRHTIPIRHSLTLGEVALLWRNERRPDADVRVIPVEGWQRDMLWPETGLPFVPPSPAINRFEAALFYAGLCLFEGTNLSVARGSPVSFEALGAPWLNVELIVDRFAALDAGCVDVAPTTFTPWIGPHAGEVCQGVRLSTTSPECVRSVATGLALLTTVMTTHRHAFEWAAYPTAANPSGEGHFERLIGSSKVTNHLHQQSTPIDTQTLKAWTETPGWKERWESIRIYS